jgi:hypothetical protein
MRELEIDIERAKNSKSPVDANAQAIANHAVCYANWKTSTEAIVALTARSPCAKRATR